MSAFPAGSVVWAPYDDGEYRLRVIDHEGEQLVCKRPGDDAGLCKVPAAKCVLSGRQPHTLMEIARGEIR
jgi:hypothetical protein